MEKCGDIHTNLHTSTPIFSTPISTVVHVLERCCYVIIASIITLNFPRMSPHFLHTSSTLPPHFLHLFSVLNMHHSISQFSTPLHTYLHTSPHFFSTPNSTLFCISTLISTLLHTRFSTLSVEIVHLSLHTPCAAPWGSVTCTSYSKTIRIHTPSICITALSSTAPEPLAIVICNTKMVPG